MMTIQLRMGFVFFLPRPGMDDTHMNLWDALCWLWWISQLDEFSLVLFLTCFILLMTKTIVIIILAAGYHFLCNYNICYGILIYNIYSVCVYMYVSSLHVIMTYLFIPPCFFLPAKQQSLGVHSNTSATLFKPTNPTSAHDSCCFSLPESPQRTYNTGRLLAEIDHFAWCTIQPMLSWH